MFKTFDNVLSEALHSEILETVSRTDFLWSYSENTVDDYIGDDSPQFTRVIQSGNSLMYQPGVKWVDAILTALDIPECEVIRAKVNMLFPRIRATSALPFHAMHTDVNTDALDADKFHSILYYINAADGNTFFFPETGENFEIPPTMNNAIHFSSLLNHASSSPVDASRRLVMNIIVKYK